MINFGQNEWNASDSGFTNAHEARGHSHRQQFSERKQNHHNDALNEHMFKHILSVFLNLQVFIYASKIDCIYIYVYIHIVYKYILICMQRLYMSIYICFSVIYIYYMYISSWLTLALCLQGIQKTAYAMKIFQMASSTFSMGDLVKDQKKHIYIYIFSQNVSFKTYGIQCQIRYAVRVEAYLRKFQKGDFPSEAACKQCGCKFREEVLKLVEEFEGFKGREACLAHLYIYIYLYKYIYIFMF